MAQIVFHDGKIQIKPDIPGSPVYYPITQIHNFRIENQPRKLPPGTYSMIAYQAWQSLCKVHPDLKPQPDWPSLHPEKKAKWIENRWEFKTDIEKLLVQGIKMILDENT